MRTCPRSVPHRVAAWPASLLLAGLVLLGAAPAHAETDADRGVVGIRLLDAPSDRADEPRAHRNIVDHLSPGDVIERRVEVRNGTNAEITVPVYVGGAELDGTQFGAFDGRDRGDLARWGEVESSEVTLAAGDTASPTVRIAVPDDAPPGERYGVIWMEAPRADDGPIAAVNRVGVRIFLSVGEGDEPPTDFRIDRLRTERPHADSLLLLADVTNTGGRALELQGELELNDGPGGLSVGPVPPARGQVVGIGGGGTVAFAFDPSLPDGAWEARLRLQSGTVERGAEARVTVPPVGETGASTASPATGAHPIALAAAFGLLLAVIIALVLVLARRRKDSPPAAPAEPRRDPMPAGAGR